MGAQMVRYYKMKLEMDLKISEELEEKLSDQGDLIEYLIENFKEQLSRGNGGVVVVSPEGTEIFNEPTENQKRTNKSFKQKRANK